MDTDVSINKPSFQDSFLVGVRQHLEAVGRNLEACEILGIGEKMHFDLYGRVGASLVGKDEDLVQPESAADGTRQFTLLLPAFSDREQHILPSSISSSFPYHLPSRPENSALMVCQCATCGEQFSTYGQYTLHRCLRVLDSPGNYAGHDRKFSRPTDLRRVCQTLETQDRPQDRIDDNNCSGVTKQKSAELLPTYSCNQCSKQFRTNSHLTRHMQIHTGVRPHKCSVCEKRFSELSSVKRHMYIHTNEAPHVCPTCGSRFSSPCYLREHMLSHTGERPNKCPICDKQYSRPGHLTRHLRQHARGQALRPVCELSKSGAEYDELVSAS